MASIINTDFMNLLVCNICKVWVWVCASILAIFLVTAFVVSYVSRV